MKLLLKIWLTLLLVLGLEGSLFAKPTLSPKKSFSRQWTLAAYRHVIRGDLRIRDGLTKIAGGMHTNKGLHDFLSSNKRQGFVYEVANVTNFDERNPHANKVLMRKLPNGVREVQFPRDAFYNADAAAISLPTQNGGRVRHIKTLWPKSFTPADVANAANGAISRAATSPSGAIHGEYRGVEFTLHLKDGKIQSIFPKFSGS